MRQKEIKISRDLYHFFAWLFFYYFWYRYFVVADGKLIASLFSLITTGFAAFTFYITSWGLFFFLRKTRKLFYFIVFAVFFIIGMSFFRTLSVLIIDRLFFPNKAPLYFMGQFFTSVFHTSYVFIFSVAVTLYRDKQKEQLRSEKQVKEKLAAELDLLKNQINPHFLFNIHNSIYFLIHEDPRAAEKAVLMLSEIMRYQLYECNAATVSLKKELHNISNYIELEKIRIGNKVRIEYTFANREHAFQIAPFILLALVENAFKHISDFANGNNFIDMEMKTTEDNFYLSVRNSMEKKTGNTNEIAKGIGLKNLLRRLELIYGEKFELLLSNENQVFSAHLKLPGL